MYNLLKDSNIYSKTSGSLFQYYRDEPNLNNDGAIVYFINDNITVSLKFKEEIIAKTGDNGINNIKMNGNECWHNDTIEVFEHSEMPLINFENDLVVTWPVNCVVSSNVDANQATTFTITDTKLYVPVVTLSTQDNAKLLQPLKSGFKKTLTGANINQKYQRKHKINI